MYTLFSVLIIITCILLVLIIMIQNPKGGGLSATFGGGSQMMGVQKTTDFLDKSTWALAITLLTLTLLSNFLVDRETIASPETELQEQIDKANFIPPSDIPIDNIEEVPANSENK